MVDLTPEQIRELKDRFGSLHEAAVKALQQPLFAEEFQLLRVTLYTTRDGSLAFNYYTGGDNEALFWKLVWATHAPRTETQRKASRRGAKELGIPEYELWWIVERRLENGERASRKWLATETQRREDLSYVPRDRLSPLVDWIDLHPEAARHALSLRTIPAEFRAGKLGPIPPQA